MLRLLLLLLITAGALAQGPAIQWQKSLGGSASEVGQAITQTTDGGYISVGYATSTNGDVIGVHGQNDYWVVRQDASGNVLWKKCLGGSANDYAQSIRQTLDGGYVIGGWTFSADGDITSTHGIDFWVVKLDTSGAIEWQKTYGGSVQEYAYCIRQTTDKGYIITGPSASINGDVTGHHAGYDMWVVKIDTAGSLQWQRSLGGTANDFGYDVIQTFDGGYIAVGYTYSNDGDVTGNQGQADAWVLKLDAVGNLQWQKTYGGTATDVTHAIMQTADSGYVVAGYAYSADGDVAGNHGSGDVWMLKLDTAGNIQWQKTYGSSGADQCFSAAKTADGGFVLAGYATAADGDVTANYGMSDYWIVKTDAAGTLQWQQAFGGSQNEQSLHIEETADGGFIIAGGSDSNDGDVTSNHGASDFWLVKLDGITTPVTTPSQNKEQITIYPNPATNTITIKAPGLPAISNYKITDLSGRIVLTGKLTGINEMININNLAPGIYVLETTGESCQSFRIVKQ